MKKALKIVGSLVLIPLLLVVVYTTYVFSNYNSYIEQSQVDELIAEILNSPNQNSALVELYNKVNNDILNKSTKSDVFQLLIGNQQYCPCFRTARSSYIRRGRKLAENDIAVAAQLERAVTQNQCLNHYLSNFDFMYNAKGVEQASIQYYKKEVHNLNQEELLGIIAMTINPYAYNPKRNREKLDAKINELKTRIQNKESQPG